MFMLSVAWFLCLFVSVQGIILAIEQDDDYRKWEDASGRYQVDAVFLSHTDSHVTLKNRDGKELTVEKAKLCRADLAYLNSMTRSGMQSEDLGVARTISYSPEQRTIKKLAEVFFADLRTTARSEARTLLTKQGQSLADQELSALMQLPSPNNGSQAIRVGTPSVAESEASVIVSVQVGQRFQKTVLEFKREEQDWRVCSITARRGDVETTVDFETPYKPEESKKDPASSFRGGSIEITGVTLDGRKVSLNDYKGKVVLVDFWATWCGPCMAEIPNVYENYLNYHDKGFEVIAISLDRDLEDLQRFIFEKNPPWPVLADRHPSNPESMASKYGIRAIPTMILIGRDGQIIDANCRGERLRAKLAELFGR